MTKSAREIELERAVVDTALAWKFGGGSDRRMHNALDDLEFYRVTIPKRCEPTDEAALALWQELAATADMGRSIAPDFARAVLARFGSGSKP